VAEGCLAVVVTVTNVHLPRITLTLCCCQRRDIQPLFDLRLNSQHHFLLFDIHFRQFKSTARDVSLEASKYTCRSSDPPHHHIANQEHIYQSFSCHDQIHTTTSQFTTWLVQDVHGKEVFPQLRASNQESNEQKGDLHRSQVWT
jgi:hypothetical protein